MRTVLILCALLTAIVAGDEGAERPDPSRGPPRPARRSPGGFGPAADGKDESHDLLEKQGWVYLLDGRIPRAEPRWDPLGLWHPRGENHQDQNAWSIVEEDGERILRCTRGERSVPADLGSNQSFWDFDLHVELRMKEASSGGIILRGRYEIKMASTRAGRPVAELVPADLGGIAGFRAPSASASRGAGEWQVIDASLRGFLLTVRLNGEVVQDGVEVPEAFRSETKAEDVSGAEVVNSPGPVILRAEQGTFEVRNIRVRPRPAPAIWREQARGE